MYLLDTNILSDLVRHPQGLVAAGITALPAEAVSTTLSSPASCALAPGRAITGIAAF
jgi:predicted nucleic acid-binding protein